MDNVNSLCTKLEISFYYFKLNYPAILRALIVDIS